MGVEELYDMIKMSILLQREKTIESETWWSLIL